MKLLAWNLNHRAARRQIPSWIAAAINEQAPDILVLTEYVEGPDHDFFLAGLNANGLSEFSCSTQPGRENQVLIASRSTQRQYDLGPPDIHPSVPSNSLEVWFGSPELAVLGFRMPAFAAKERALKRLTWNWLLGEADRLSRSRSAFLRPPSPQVEFHSQLLNDYVTIDEYGRTLLEELDR
jgi:hypothetical protein